MEPNNEVQRVKKDSEDEERMAKKRRPPSSYGSMKSDCEEMEEELLQLMKEPHKEGVTTIPLNLTARDETGLLLTRSDSPETLYTVATQQTKHPVDVVIPTGYFAEGEAMEMNEEEEEEEEDEYHIINSPEPPEFIESEDFIQTDESGQRGSLHPECDLPHIFKSIQAVLSGLNTEELDSFRMSFHQWEPKITQQQVMEGDLLDFVNVAMEVLGRDQSLIHTLQSLEAVRNKEKADELRALCKRALTRHSLATCLIRKHEAIHEGVVRAGDQNYLRNIYVEPEISLCGDGGGDPSHELPPPYPPSGPQGPGANTLVGLNDLFRQQKHDGTPVRTVLTTGLPGIGMSVSVAKFSLDWAKEHSNRDLQFVIKLSFRKWWLYRTKKWLPSEKISIMGVIEYLYPDCKDVTYLEEEDCKFLIIMDSFDCYQAPLDWKNAPVITDNRTKAHPDVLIVNIVRGTVLRGANVWILGRRAAVSQIPSKFIDAFTVIQGFSDEMKEDFLSKRAESAEQAQQIVAHFKQLPALVRLARQPFVCWMAFTVFERCFRSQGYGAHPPRLTPFYMNVMIVQMNRRLEFYYGQSTTDLCLEWSGQDKVLLLKIGKMALKMLESNTGVFSENEVKQCNLQLTEVTVLSGMCTELPTAASNGQRRFCFLDFTFQEFMAALYVFHKFRMESNIVLEPRSVKSRKDKHQPVSAAALVECALKRTFTTPLGRFDMFLRFLCGLLNVDCHEQHLGSVLYHHKTPKMPGLEEAQQLVRDAVQTAPEERRENLKECLREMTQKDL